MFAKHSLLTRLASLAGHARLPDRLWRITNLDEHLSVLPFTIQISGQRGRPVTGVLSLQVAEQEGHTPKHGRLVAQGVDSATRVVYPLSSQPALLQTYTLNDSPPSSAAASNPSSPNLASSSPRTPLYHTGLFLEDLDTFAADVAARHVDLSNKKLVTAYVDTILWLQHAVAYQGHGVGASTPVSPLDAPAASLQLPAVDLHMTGQVTWVGRSSLEVTLEVTREGGESSESAGHKRERELVGMARFVMAARDLTMKRSMAVPTLAVEGGSVEEQLVAEGAHRSHARQHRRERDAQPMSEEEASHLSQLLQQRAGRGSADKATPPPPPSLQEHMAASDRGTRSAAGGHGIISSEARHASRNGAASCDSCATGGDGDIHVGGRDGSSADSCAGSNAAADKRCDLQPPSNVGPAYLTPVPIHNTEKHHTLTTQWQHRNTIGYVFGGQLLRWGHDMAVAVGTAHAGQGCRLVAMRDVPFVATVPLGCEIHLTGKVVYVDGPVLHVHVRAYRTEEAGSAADELAHRAPHHAHHTCHHVSQLPPHPPLHLKNHRPHSQSHNHNHGPSSGLGHNHSPSLPPQPNHNLVHLPASTGADGSASDGSVPDLGFSITLADIEQGNQGAPQLPPAHHSVQPAHLSDPSHQHLTRRVQTHSFYIALTTNNGDSVAPVVPGTATEEREWLHARRMHLDLFGLSSAIPGGVGMGASMGDSVGNIVDVRSKAAAVVGLRLGDAAEGA